MVALVALYRPGPLHSGMVDDFIDRKHGRAEVTYLHPCLETILKETYGVIVYQASDANRASHGRYTLALPIYYGEPWERKPRWPNNVIFS